VVARLEDSGAQASDESPADELVRESPAHARGTVEPAGPAASEARILGRLTSLGRASDGAIRMRWSVRVPLELGAGGEHGSGEHGAGAPGTVRARLYTGSGEPGVPGGLVLGTTELPSVVRAGEEHELLLDAGLDPAAVRRLFVRRESAEARP
jgi:hypothetical protein